MIHCEDIPRHPDFKPPSSIETAQADLCYASKSNFNDSVLYKGCDCAWQRREAADGIKLATAGPSRVMRQTHSSQFI